MTSIKHVVFDIGRVLITWDPEKPFRRLIPDDAERAHFLTHVCSPAWNLEQDRGRSWQDAEALLIAEHPDHEAYIRAYRKHWREMVTPEIPQSVAILRHLMATGMDVTMLTNFASDTFREAQAMYPFLTETRGVTVSGDVKVLKPDPNIYRIHTEGFSLDPAVTLFIDDSAANIEGAKAFGWQAALFESPEKLRRDLLDFGLAV